MAKKRKRTVPLAPSRYRLVKDARVKVIIYEVNENMPAGRKGIAALQTELIALVGDEERVDFDDYGGPNAWTAELRLECQTPFELGVWAERIATTLRRCNAPAKGSVIVASFDQEWGVDVYPPDEG